MKIKLICISLNGREPLLCRDSANVASADLIDRMNQMPLYSIARETSVIRPTVVLNAFDNG